MTLNSDLGQLQKPSEHPSRGRRVLLVEDEEPVARLLVKSLENSGFEVLFARDGETALGLATLEATSPDLLITDLSLPGIQGVEVARTLTGRWPSLPVLLTSGYAFDALTDAASLPVEFEFMPKPFTPLAFVQRVRSMVGNGR
jgi:two-component system, cell cycle sensor histidine kinase and response regulator CckA